MGGLLSVNHLTGEHAMRLLILGATGGTGRALIRQARERGHEATAFVRSPQKLGPSLRAYIHHIVGIARGKRDQT